MSKPSRNASKSRRLSSQFIKRLSSWLALSTVLTVGTSHLANATTYYWDADGSLTGDNITTGVGLGGSGTWNTSSLLWWDTVNPLVAWPNSTGDTAVFEGSAGVVQLGAPINVGTLTFNTAGYILTGDGSAGTNTLTLGGSAAIQVNVAGTDTISAAIAGTAGLNVSSNTTGTLVLTNTNSNFTGGVTIASGTLGIYSDLSLGALANGITFTNAAGTAATLAFDAPVVTSRTITLSSTAGAVDTLSSAVAGQQVFLGQITGGTNTGLLNIVNTGTTYLLNTGNNFTSALGITNGTVIINALTDATGSGNIKIGATAAATFEYAPSATSGLTFSNRSIELAGATNGATIDNESINAAGAITINSNLVVSANGAKTLTLTGLNTGTNFFNGNIVDSGSGATSVTKTGQDLWVLGGTNTYTGTLTLTYGTLRLTAAQNNVNFSLNANGTSANAVLELRSDTANNTVANDGFHWGLNLSNNNTTGGSIIYVDRAVGGTGSGNTAVFGTVAQVSTTLFTAVADHGYNISIGVNTDKGGALTTYQITNDIGAPGVPSYAAGVLTVAGVTTDTTSGTGATQTFAGFGNTNVGAILNNASNLTTPLNITDSGTGLVTFTGNNSGWSNGTLTSSGGITRLIASNSLAGGATLTLGGGTVELRNNAATNFAASSLVTVGTTILLDQAQGGSGNGGNLMQLGNMTVTVAGKILTVVGDRGDSLFLAGLTSNVVTSTLTIANDLFAPGYAYGSTTPGTLSLGTVTGANASTVLVTLTGPGTYGTFDGSTNKLTQGTATSLNLTQNSLGVVTLSGSQSGWTTGTLTTTAGTTRLIGVGGATPSTPLSGGATLTMGVGLLELRADNGTSLPSFGNIAGVAAGTIVVGHTIGGSASSQTETLGTIAGSASSIINFVGDNGYSLTTGLVTSASTFTPVFTNFLSSPGYNGGSYSPGIMTIGGLTNASGATAGLNLAGPGNYSMGASSISNTGGGTLALTHSGTGVLTIAGANASWTSGSLVDTAGTTVLNATDTASGVGNNNSNVIGTANLSLGGGQTELRSNFGLAGANWTGKTLTTTAASTLVVAPQVGASQASNTFNFGGFTDGGTLTADTNHVSGLQFNSAVTVAVSQTITNIGDGTVTFSGGLTNTASSTYTLNGSGDFNVSGNIVAGTGATAVTKSGLGLVTLGGSGNAFTGLLTVNAGVLRVTATGGLGAAGSTITLQGNTAGSGTPGLDLRSDTGIDASQRNFTASTYNGLFNVDHAVVGGTGTNQTMILGGGALANASNGYGDTFLGANGYSLQFGSTGNATAISIPSNAGTFTLTNFIPTNGGTGTGASAGIIFYNGLTYTSLAGASTFALAGTGDYLIASTGALTATAPTAAATLSKTGTGTLIISSNNAASWNTAVNTVIDDKAGIVRATLAGALGGGLATFKLDGGTLDLRANTGFTVTNPITVAANSFINVDAAVGSTGSTGQTQTLSGVTLPANTLFITGGSQSSTNTYNLNTGTVTMTGAPTFVNNIGNSGTLTIPSLTGTQNVIFTGGGTTNISAATIVTGTITKSGTGTVTFTEPASANTTGNLTVNAGTLAADYSTGSTNTIFTTTDTLTLGGGTLAVKGATSGTTSQTLSNLTLAAGGSTISINPNGGTSTTLALGTIPVGVVGATLLVDESPAGVGTGSAIVTTTSNSNGVGNNIISPVSIIHTAANGYTFMGTPSGGSAPYTLGAYPTGGAGNGGTTGATVLITGATTAASNYYISGSGPAIGQNDSINTLQITPTTSSQSFSLNGKALTITTGGLLYTGGSNGYTIGPISGAATGSSLIGGNTTTAFYSLMVQNYGTNTSAAALGITAVVANNASNATAFVQAGTGFTQLGNATTANNNTYSGTTYVNGGTLQIVNSTQLGNAVGNALTVNGGTFDVNGNSITAGTVTVAYAGTIDNSAAGTATLSIGSGSTTPSILGTIKNSGGKLSVTKIGTGTATLGDVNGMSSLAFTGDLSNFGTGTTSTIVLNTTLADTASTKINMGSATASDNQVLTFSGNTNEVLNNRQLDLTGQSGVTINANGTLSQNGTSAVLVINSNVLTDGSGGKTLTLTATAGNVANGGTGAGGAVTSQGVSGITGSGNVAVVNAINGNILDAANGTGAALALTISGNGGWSLGGNNNYSGGTLISSTGLVRATSATAFGNSAGAVNVTGANATLDLRSDSNLSFGNTFQMNNSFTINVDRAVGGTGYGGLMTIAALTELTTSKTLTVQNITGTSGSLGASDPINGYGLNITALNLNAGTATTITNGLGSPGTATLAVPAATGTGTAGALTIDGISTAGSLTTHTLNISSGSNTAGVTIINGDITQGSGTALGINYTGLTYLTLANQTAATNYSGGLIINAATATVRATNQYSFGTGAIQLTAGTLLAQSDTSLDFTANGGGNITWSTAASIALQVGEAINGTGGHNQNFTFGNLTLTGATASTLTVSGVAGANNSGDSVTFGGVVLGGAAATTPIITNNLLLGSTGTTGLLNLGNVTNTATTGTSGTPLTLTLLLKGSGATTLGNVTDSGTAFNYSAIIYNGTGYLDLASATSGNSYTGGLTITTGTVRASNNNSLGASGNTVILNGGTLELRSDTGLTAAPAFSLLASSTVTLGQLPGGTGTGAYGVTDTLGTLTPTASGKVLTISGVDGTTAANGDNLKINTINFNLAANNTATITNNLLLPSMVILPSVTNTGNLANATLTINGSGTTQLNSVQNGATFTTGIVSSPTGYLDLTGATSSNTYTGGLKITAGTTRIMGSTSIAAGGGFSGGTYGFGGTANVVNLAGGTLEVRSDTGFTNANAISFNASTTITIGQLAGGTSSTGGYGQTIQLGQTTLATTGGTLTINGLGATAASNAYNLTLNGVVDNVLATTLTNSLPITSTLTINGITNTGAVAGPNVLTFNGQGVTVIAGDITDSTNTNTPKTALAVSAGTVNIASATVASTYSGGLTLSGGTLRMLNAAGSTGFGLGSAAMSLAGGTWEIRSDTDVTYANVINETASASLNIGQLPNGTSGGQNHTVTIGAINAITTTGRTLTVSGPAGLGENNGYSLTTGTVTLSVAGYTIANVLNLPGVINIPLVTSGVAGTNIFTVSGTAATVTGQTTSGLTKITDVTDGSGTTGIVVINGWLQMSPTATTAYTGGLKVNGNFAVGGVRVLVNPTTISGGSTTAFGGATNLITLTQGTVDVRVDSNVNIPNTFTMFGNSNLMFINVDQLTPGNSNVSKTVTFNSATATSLGNSSTTTNDVLTFTSSNNYGIAFTAGLVDPLSGNTITNKASGTVNLGAINYTGLTGGTLTINGTGVTVVGNITTSPTLATNLALTYSGTGLLDLTGNNGATGPLSSLTLSGVGGITKVSAGVNLGTAVALNGAILQVRTDNGGTINANITFGNALSVNNSTTGVIDVGNNGGGATGNTIAFGALTNSVGSASDTLTINGANGYKASFTSLALPGSTNGGAMTLVANAPVIINGNVTNPETGGAATNYSVLLLDGVAGGNGTPNSAVNGLIQDATGSTVASQGLTHVTKQGPGTWVLNPGAGGNSYLGVTSVLNGVLQSGSNNAISGAVGSGLNIIATGAAVTATVDLAGFNQTLQIATTGTGASGVQTATLIMGGSTTTSQAILTNSTGTSTLTLSGNTGTTGDVSYPGTSNPLDAIISATNLNLGGAGRTFNIVKSTSASNGLPNVPDMLVTSNITNGSILKTGTGTLELAGPGTSSPTAASVTAGSLLIGTLAALPTSTPVTINGGTLAIDAGGTGQYTGANLDTLMSNATQTSGTLAIDTTGAGATGTVTSTSSGLVTGPLVLTHYSSNASALTVSGNLTTTANITNLGGTLNLTGGSWSGSTTTSNLVYGTAAVSSVVNVNENLSFDTMTGGAISGAVAVYNQTGGTVNISAAGNAQYVVNAAGAYGYFNVTGGTFQMNGAAQFDMNPNTAGTGVVYLGGTLNIGAGGSGGSYILMDYGAGLSEFTVGPGGVINHNGASQAISLNWTTAGSYSVFNLTGGTVNTDTRPLQFGATTNASTGFMNLDAGTVNSNVGIANALTATTGVANSYINFAGGTFKTGLAIPTGILPGVVGTGTSAITVFGAIANSAATGISGQLGTTQDFVGGLTINTNNVASSITGTIPLSGATGDGVTQANIAIPSTGNSGYVGAPMVQFAAPASGGSAATGYAIISGGAVTGIVITSPGSYAANETPLITLTGGGGTIAAFNTTGSLTLNSANASSQTLSVTGGGTLTLGGVNTYGGTTNVFGNSILKVSNVAAIPNTVTLGSSGTIGTLDLNGVGATITGVALGASATAASQVITNSNATASTLTFNVAGSFTLPAITIQNGTGTTAVAVTGGGSLRMDSSFTYTGGTNVQNGTLNFAGTSTVATNALTTASTLTLGSTSGGTGTASFGNGTKATTLTVTGLTTAVGASTSSAIVGNSPNGGSVSGNSVLTVNIATGVTDLYAGQIGGTSGFQNNINVVKSGGGTLELSGNLTNWTTTGGVTPTFTLAGGVLQLDSSATFNTTIYNTGGIIVDNGYTQGPNFSLIVSGGLLTINTATDGFADVNTTSSSHGVVALNFPGNTGVTNYNGSDMFLGAIGARIYSGTSLTPTASLSYHFGGGGNWGALGTTVVGGGGGYLQVAAANVVTNANSVTIGDNGTYNSGAGLFGGNSTVEFTASQNFTGNLFLAGGSFAFSATNQFGNAANPVVFSGGNLLFDTGNTTDVSARLTLGANYTLQPGNVVVTPNYNIDTNGNSVNFATALANTGSNTGGLSKLGLGTLTLAATSANTYTGPTSVYGGTLLLDMNAAAITSNLVSSSSALQLDGGTFAVKGHGGTTANTQNFNGTSFGTAASLGISAASGFTVINPSFGAAVTGGGGLTLTLGTLTRTIGSAAQITFGANSSATNTTFNATGLTASTLITDGFSVPYMIVGTTDWASANVGATAIVGGSTVTGFYTQAAATIPANPGTAVNLDNNTIGSAAIQNGLGTISLGSFRFSNVGARTLTLGATAGDVLQIGGFLMSSTVTTSNNQLITGGVLTSLQAGGDITFFGENGAYTNGGKQYMQVASLIQDHAGGSTGVTAAGPSLYYPSNAANTYTGVTSVIGGAMINITLTTNPNASSFIGNNSGAASFLVINNGTLYDNGNATFNRAFTMGLQGATVQSDGTNGLFNVNGTAGATQIALQGNGSRTLTLAGASTGSTANVLNNLALGVIDQGGPTSLVKTGAGSWLLNATNSYTGTTTIIQGELAIGSATALPGGVGVLAPAVVAPTTSGGNNLIFAGTGTNNAVLQLTSGSGGFYRSVGTGFDQVSWSGNGGFDANGAPENVNLGGSATPSTLVWNATGFVNTGNLIFGGANATALLTFQNGLDLNGASRTVQDDRGPLTLATSLSGVISNSSGTAATFNKTGLGLLELTSSVQGTGTVNTQVSLGTLAFSNMTTAVPGAGSGQTVTVLANAAVEQPGSTDLTALLGRLNSASTGVVAFDTSNSTAVNMSGTGLGNIYLGAVSNLGGTPVYYNGTITPFNNIYKFANGSFASPGTTLGSTSTAVQLAENLFVLNGANMLANNGLTARSAVFGSSASTQGGSGTIYVTSYNTYTGGTTIGQATGAAGTLSNNAGAVTAVGIGNDSALGTGTITLGGNNSFGALNGDHTLSNNLTTPAALTTVVNLGGNFATDGVVNAGAMTYLGTVNLSSVTTGGIMDRNTATPAIITGDIITNSTTALAFNSPTAGTLEFLTTPAGAVAVKTMNSSNVGFNWKSNSSGTVVIDSAGSFGAGPSTTQAGFFNMGVTTGATLQVLPGITTGITLNAKEGLNGMSSGATFQFAVSGEPTFNDSTGASIGGPIGNSSLTVQGVITGSSAAGNAFFKTGEGTLTLQGAGNGLNLTAAASAFTIGGGTLSLDFGLATANQAFFTTTTNALQIGGATGGPGTLSLVGSASAQTNSASFGATLLKNDDNAISLNSNAGTVNLTLGAITNTLGGTIAVTLPTSGAITLATTNTVLVSGSTTSTTNANGLLVDANLNPYVVVGGTDWGAFSTTGTALVAGSSIAAFYTATTGTAFGANTNADLTIGTTLSATSTTVNSLRLNTASALTLDLGAHTLITGGILMGTGATTNNQVISDGTLEGISGKNLPIYQADASAILTISANINDNTTATALSKAGPGTLILSGANSYTGVTYFNGGVVSVASVALGGTASPLGKAAANVGVFVFNGGTLRYTGASNGTTDQGFNFNAISAIDVTTGGVQLISTTSKGWNGVAGTPGILRKIGAGTLSLNTTTTTNANLSVEVQNGILNIGATTATKYALQQANGAALIIDNGAKAVITSATAPIDPVSSVVVLTGGTLDLNSTTGLTIDGLAGGATSGLPTGGTVTSAGGTPTLTLGSANDAAIAPYTVAAAAAGVASTGLANFGGSITGTIALNKVGAGTQILSGTGNTYSGNTTITAGTLRLGAANALPSGTGKGNVTIFGDATNSTVAGLIVPGMLDMGGYDQNINGLNSTTGGYVTNTPTLSNNGTNWGVTVGSGGFQTSGFTAATSTDTLTVGNGNANGAFSGILQDGFTVIPVAGSGAGTGVSGFLALTKTGTGTQALSGANTATGALTVNQGELDLNTTGNNAWSGNAVVAGGNLKLLQGNQLSDLRGLAISSGTFDLGGFSETVAGFSGTGGVVDNTGATASTFTFGSGNGTSAFTGVIQNSGSGSLGLSKVGSGVFTLSNTNTYSGPTSVSGGAFLVNGTDSGTGAVLVSGSGTILGGSGSIAGAVTLGASTFIAPGSAASTVGTLTLSGGISFSSTSTFTVDVGAGANNADKLTITGAPNLNGSNITFQASSPDQGRYVLLTSTGSLTGTFNGTAPIGYSIVYSANEVDLVHLATISTITSQTGLQIITGGSAPFTFTVANSAPAGGANLSFSATSGTNTTGSAGPVSVAAQSTSGATSGLTFTGSTVGAGRTGSFTVTDSGATNSPQTGSVSVDVYDHAASTLSTGTVALGNHHVGYTGPLTSNTLSVSDATGFRANLKGSAPGSGNITLNSVSGLTPGGANGSIGATLAAGQTAGAINQLFTYTFADDSLLSGASSNVGTASITVTGLIYNGQGVWSTDGSGSWNDFSKWAVPGGVPGIDGGLSIGDTATFQSVTPDATPRTVSLNGTSPSLAAITFNSSAQSYTIVQGSGGGTIGLQLNATITDSNGNHLISAPVDFGSSNTVGVSVAGGNTLTMSGQITGAGSGLTKSGNGALVLSGANTYTGATWISSGTAQAGVATVTSVGVPVSGAFGVDSAVRSDGTLELAGFSNTIGSLEGGGPNAFVKNSSGGAATLTIDGTNGTPKTFSGAIQDTAGTALSVVKQGSGTQVLSGANTYSGTTTVADGKLVVAGSISGSVNVSGVSTAILASGHNTTSTIGGNVTLLSGALAGGILAPGDTGDTSGTTTIGRLTVNGDLTVGGAGAPAHLAIEIGGTTGGTLSDQIQVASSSTVTLTNANLDLTLAGSFNPTTLTIASYNTGTNQLDQNGSLIFIVTGSTHAVVGTFANAGAEDGNLTGFGTYNLGGQEFAISYTADINGNSGNGSFTGGHDIALMAVPEPNSLAMLAGSLGMALGLQRFRRRRS